MLYDRRGAMEMAMKHLIGRKDCEICHGSGVVGTPGLPCTYCEPDESSVPTPSWGTPARYWCPLSRMWIVDGVAPKDKEDPDPSNIIERAAAELDMVALSYAPLADKSPVAKAHYDRITGLAASLRYIKLYKAT